MTHDRGVIEFFDDDIGRVGIATMNARFKERVWLIEMEFLCERRKKLCRVIISSIQNTEWTIMKYIHLVVE